MEMAANQSEKAYLASHTREMHIHTNADSQAGLKQCKSVMNQLTKISGTLKTSVSGPRHTNTTQIPKPHKHHTTSTQDTRNSNTSQTLHKNHTNKHRQLIDVLRLLESCPARHSSAPRSSWVALNVSKEPQRLPTYRPQISPITSG